MSSCFFLTDDFRFNLEEGVAGWPLLYWSSLVWLDRRLLFLPPEVPAAAPGVLGVGGVSPKKLNEDLEVRGDLVDDNGVAGEGKEGVMASMLDFLSYLLLAFDKQHKSQIFLFQAI